MDATTSPSERQEKKQPFFFWEPILREGGVVIASPYRIKYHGGVSPRDALAMANVIALFSPWSSQVSIRAEIRSSLTPELEQENLILIGSGSANLVVPDILSDLDKAGTPVSFSLGSGFWQDYAARQGMPSNIIPRYVTGNLDPDAMDLGAQFCQQDFGLVARAPNPHKAGKVIIFIAGIHGYGTLAASHVFCNPEYQKEIESKLKNKPISRDPDIVAIGRDAVIEVLLRTTVSDDGHDRANQVRGLKSIGIEFVRVGSSIDRQSPSEPSPRSGPTDSPSQGVRRIYNISPYFVTILKREPAPLYNCRVHNPECSSAL